jgi:hypothetical protein
MGPHDQQPAQVSIAPFRDAAEPLLAARRGLSRRQPKKGGERVRARESQGLFGPVGSHVRRDGRRNRREVLALEWLAEDRPDLGSVLGLRPENSTWQQQVEAR